MSSVDIGWFELGGLGITGVEVFRDGISLGVTDGLSLSDVVFVGNSPVEYRAQSIGVDGSRSELSDPVTLNPVAAGECVAVALNDGTTAITWTGAPEGSVTVFEPIAGAYLRLESASRTENGIVYFVDAISEQAGQANPDYRVTAVNDGAVSSQSCDGRSFSPPEFERLSGIEFPVTDDGFIGGTSSNAVPTAVDLGNRSTDTSLSRPMTGADGPLPLCSADGLRFIISDGDIPSVSATLDIPAGHQLRYDESFSGGGFQVRLRVTLFNDDGTPRATDSELIQSAGGDGGADNQFLVRNSANFDTPAVISFEFQNWVITRARFGAIVADNFTLVSPDGEVTEVCPLNDVLECEANGGNYLNDSGQDLELEDGTVLEDGACYESEGDSCTGGAFDEVVKFVSDFECLDEILDAAVDYFFVNDLAILTTAAEVLELGVSGVRFSTDLVLGFIEEGEIRLDELLMDFEVSQVLLAIAAAANTITDLELADILDFEQDLFFGCIEAGVQFVTGGADVFMALVAFEMDPLGFIAMSFTTIREAVQEATDQPEEFVSAAVAAVLQLQVLEDQGFARWSGLVGCTILIEVAIAFATGGASVASPVNRLRRLIDDFLTANRRGGDNGGDNGNGGDNDNDGDNDPNLPVTCTALRSFSGDTEVLLADGTALAIADVEVGDVVFAHDPETGLSGAREVLATWPHTDTLVEFEVGDSTVTTTEDHEFWNVTDQAWQETQHIDAGDLLLTADGAVTWLYHRPRKISTPVPVGVTADIVEDLGQPGVSRDWLEYDFDGNPLPGTAREALGNAGEQYRSIGYDLRRWATDSPDALDEDFTPLGQVVAQALALLAFVGFAGLALAVSPSDTMQSVGKWLLFLAPMFGVYLLVRNFGQRRKS